MFSFVFAHAEVFLPLFSIDLAVELVLLTPHAGDIVRPACEKSKETYEKRIIVKLSKTIEHPTKRIGTHRNHNGTMKL